MPDVGEQVALSEGVAHQISTDNPEDTRSRAWKTAGTAMELHSQAPYSTCCTPFHPRPFNFHMRFPFGSKALVLAQHLHGEDLPRALLRYLEDLPEGAAAQDGEDLKGLGPHLVELPLLELHKAPRPWPCRPPAQLRGGLFVASQQPLHGVAAGGPAQRRGEEAAAVVILHSPRA